jgi:hypothetical protein
MSESFLEYDFLKDFKKSSDVGSSHPGAVVRPKGLAVRQ